MLTPPQRLVLELRSGAEALDSVSDIFDASSGTPRLAGPGGVRGRSSLAGDGLVYEPVAKNYLVGGTLIGIHWICDATWDDLRKFSETEQGFQYRVDRERLKLDTWISQVPGITCNSGRSSFRTLRGREANSRFELSTLDEPTRGRCPKGCLFGNRSMAGYYRAAR